MRFDDAALNTGDKPDAKLSPVRWDRGRADCQENKVFYFLSYEGTRDHLAVDRTVTIPWPSMLAGDLQG